jgi:Domain of unknown function (DUF4091)
LGLLLWLTPAHAQIAVDATTSSGNCGNVSSCAWTHVLSGSASDIYVGVAVNHGFSGPTITSVTVGATTLSLVKTQHETAQNYDVSMYHAFSPPTGSQTITVTLTGVVGTTNGFFAAAISFTGSNTTLIDATPVGVDQSTSSLTVSGNITTINPNAWIIDVVMANASNGTLTLVPAPPQTMPINNGSAVGATMAMSYNGPIAIPASTSDGYSYSAVTKFALIIASLRSAPFPAASVSPASLTYAAIPLLTSSAAQVVTLTNIGDATMTISSITFTGANGGDFSKTTTCAGTLASLASCTVSVTFTPISAGTRTANLSINDNAPTNPHIVPLTGSSFLVSNPLIPANVPAMDTNCAHAQYSTTSWLTDTMQKVRQDAGTNPGSACTLTVAGTLNEFLDFQVHYHDAGSGTTGLKVTVGNFVQTAPSTYTIPTSSTTAGIVYREGYINVQTHPTNNQLDSAVPGGATQNTFYSGGPLGFYPDILIPTVDPYWNQTTNAFPFTVSAGNNQSAWVDIFIPAGAPAGYYLGSVLVQSGCPSSCVTVSTMPVTLKVWQWPNRGFMPSTPTLPTEMSSWGYGVACEQMYDPVTFTRACNAYPGPDNLTASGNTDTAVIAQWIDGDLMLKDHRFNAGGIENMFPGGGSFVNYTNRLNPIMLGGCVHGGTVCPILTGSKNTTKQLSFLSTASQPVWANWQTNFAANGWGTPGNIPLYDYLQDEPHTTPAFTNVHNNGSARHGFLTPAVSELLTTDFYLSQGSLAAAQTMSNGICGSISCLWNDFDILLAPLNIMEGIGGSPAPQPLSLYTNWAAASNPSGAKRLWGEYLTCSEGGTCTNGTPGPGPSTYTYVTWPNLAIDGKPAANRVSEWLTYLHGGTIELYFGADTCQNHSYFTSCDPSGTYVNGWSSLYNNGNWGDGSLIYFGSNDASGVNYMGAGVTIPIYLPSIRLKHMRDGVQDYEYLYKLNAMGNGTFVNTQVASWVTNSYNFETSGAGLEAARLALGNQLNTLSFSGGSTLK